jgi:hypothetical protein
VLARSEGAGAGNDKLPSPVWSWHFFAYDLKPSSDANWWMRWRRFEPVTRKRFDPSAEAAKESIRFGASFASHLDQTAHPARLRNNGEMRRGHFFQHRTVFRQPSCGSMPSPEYHSQ